MPMTSSVVEYLIFDLTSLSHLEAWLCCFVLLLLGSAFRWFFMRCLSTFVIVCTMFVTVLVFHYCGV